MPAKIIKQARAACADEGRLRQALNGADIVPLMMSLVHLTGEARWLDEAAPYIKGGWSFLASLPDDLQQRIREKLVDTLKDLASGRAHPAQISEELLTRMMHSSVGAAVPSPKHTLSSANWSRDSPSRLLPCTAPQHDSGTNQQ